MPLSLVAMPLLLVAIVTTSDAFGVLMVSSASEFPQQVFLCTLTNSASEMASSRKEDDFQKKKQGTTGLEP